jgi:hypothetical protein
MEQIIPRSRPIPPISFGRKPKTYRKQATTPTTPPIAVRYEILFEEDI